MKTDGWTYFYLAETGTIRVKTIAGKILVETYDFVKICWVCIPEDDSPCVGL